MSSFEDEVEKAVKAFNADYSHRKTEMKVHRFPANLRTGLGDQYVVPLVVAIGPYHRHLPRLQEMESVKLVAVYHFMRHSGKLYRQIMDSFFSIAYWARSCYADAGDDVAGMDGHDFVVMMLRDACFLLQYMVAMSSVRPKSSIDDFPEDQLFTRFLFSNRASIDNDIMLLENQLPWLVVQSLLRFLPDEHVLETFVARLASTFQSNQGVGRTTDERERVNSLHALLHTTGGGQPHLLGIFRLYKIGLSRSEPIHDGVKNQGGVSVPVSATELAGVAIKLTPSDARDLADMGIRRGRLFDKFFLPPLYLDNVRACWLVNMAALELCMAASLSDGDFSVCSYLALVAMLMNREEDVHHAREKRFLQGEITDKQMVSFFNTITELISPGQGYFNILADIEACMRRRWVRIMVQKFFSDNAKAIAAVLSVVGVLVGIFKTLFSLKQHQR